MCFHLGMTDYFVWDQGQPTQRSTDEVETRSILAEIYYEVVKQSGELLYSHHVRVCVCSFILSNFILYSAEWHVYNTIDIICSLMIDNEPGHFF